MKMKVFSENTWIYPDDVIDETSESVKLDTARGGMACFQVLTDTYVKTEDAISIMTTAVPGIRTTVYRLIPVCVDKNSGKDRLTGPYEEVAEFATKKAPFYVYDAMCEIGDDLQSDGRLAFFVRVEADSLCATGEKKIEINISAAGESAQVNVLLNVHKATVPSLPNARFGMVNWLNVNHLCRQQRSN